MGSGLDSHRRTILGPHLGSIGREGQYSEKKKKNSLFYVQAEQNLRIFELSVLTGENLNSGNRKISRVWP